MKIKKHARYLSILLALMMVFSTAAVFADVEADSQVSSDDGVTTITTEEDFDAEEEALDDATIEEDSEEVVQAEDIVLEEKDAALTDAESAAEFTDVKPTITLKKKYDKNDYEGAKDNGFILTWKHSDDTGVDAYQVLRWKKGSSSKSVLKTVKAGGSYKLEVLSPFGTYYYAVKAISYKSGSKSIAKSITSSSKSVQIKGVLTKTEGINWYGKAKRKAVIYKKGSGSAKKTTVKKGTKMRAIGRYPKKVKKFHYASRVQVTFKSKGKKVKGWIKWSDLSGGVKGNIIVKRDYTRSLKEQFVNETYNKKHKGKATPIKSKDSTLLWTCLHTQRVYTFKKSGGKWKLIRSDRVTTGKYSQPTRSSEKAGKIFTISKKIPGRVWMVQENGRRYYFTHQAKVNASGVSFHTGTWWENGATRGTVVKSGAPGTYGCIRMYTGPAIKLFNRVKTGKTAVLITMED